MGGDKRRAARWRTRARRRCQEYGLVAQEASILRDMAEVAFTEHRNRVASRWLGEAEEKVRGTEWVTIARSIEEAKQRWIAAGAYQPTPRWTGG